ncbi:MAG TPA: ABC transporter permease [Rhodocyclaceae bacterium]|uniref:ABC transporter permease n=1 Tax=Thauera sp. TaxID=1905334 RepID=UPI002CA0F488|nr:ABC transporter permease [Thauera sp.]HRP25205.1 ABC transporter permease [Thauera sp.]HRQ48780.1 ABC transporter permease [Rhodocyclaceae bacterium]
MQNLTRLAARNLWRNRVRTLVTLGAIIFGVCGLILSGGFVRDIFVQLGEALIHSQSGHVQVGREAVFTYGSRTPERYLIENHQAVRERIASLPEVKDVMGRVAFSGLLNNGKTDYPIIAEGVEPARENALGTHLHLVAGRMLADDDRFGAMLGEGVARALRLGPGDQATLLVSTLDGAMNTLDVEVIGVFQSFSKDFDARAVRIALPDAQDLLATTGVSRLVVSLHDTASTRAVVDSLRPSLAAQELAARDWQQLNDFYGKTVALYEQQFGFLKAMVLLMVCLSVINTINMSLAERSWEFGTMRALGNRSRVVASLIMSESVTLGVLGATIGVVLGVGLALMISGVGIPMPPPPNADLGYDAFIRVVPAVVIESWLIGLAATAVAAIYPAWRLSRQSIIDALRTRE